MNKLYRSRKNKMLAGVCGGLADHLNIDPLVVRIATAVLTIFTLIPLLLYIVAIFVVPLEPENSEESPSVQPTANPDMGEHVRILGILYIVLGAIGLLGAIIAFIAIIGAGMVSGNRQAITVTSIVAIFVAGFVILVCAPGVIGGFGLLKRQSWARILVMVLGCINLFNIPIGTAVGIYTIWTLNHKNTNALFNPHEEN